MAIGADQSIYVADPGVGQSLRRITPVGMAELVTGGPGSAYDLSDRRAIDMQIASARSLHMSPDGILTLVSDNGAKVRQITPDGMLHTIVGNGNDGAIPTDGTLAASSPTYSVPDAVQAADGTIYLPSRSPVIHRVAPALPGLKYGQFFFPSTDGGELYVFGEDGRHIATRDATTLRNVLTFQYDASGALASVTDAGGLLTTVQASRNGSAASLVSSHGVRTTIDVDANGFARQLTGPSGYAMTPQHDSLGLLTALRDARGLPHRFRYDSLGLLTQDADTLGAQSLMAYLTSDKSTVVHTLASGETTTYTVERALTQVVTQTTTIAGQTPDSTVFGRDGTTVRTHAGGAASQTLAAPDPRLGLPVAYDKTTTYQEGSLSGTVQRSRAALGASTDGTTATGTLLDSTRVNGRLYLDSLDLGARSAIGRSPLGRRRSTLFDLRGNTLATQAWARLARTFTYDSAAQLLSRTEGGRVDSVQWNALGQPSRVRRPDGSVVTYARDTLGRVLALGLPGGLSETFVYDAGGNRTRASLLGGRQYGFTYNAHDQLTADSLVSAGLELGRYTYDRANHLRTWARAGRPLLSYDYDAAGRVTLAGSATTWARFTYDPASNKPSTIAASSGQTYAISYDGRLPRIVRASGLAVGEVEYVYSNDLRARIVRINDQSVDYAFDADGLITRGGALSLDRDAVTGAITRDSIGLVATTRTYDDHGALARLDVRVGGAPVASQALQRDSLGRLTAVADSSSAGAFTTGYRYDALDRLDQVSRDGTVMQQLTYDLAGNRLASTTSAGGVAATYASDDRLLSFDGRPITHDAARARATEVTASDSLAYGYDDVGRLTSVTSSAAGVLAFRYDALGRRVQELRDGVVVRQFVYGTGAGPIGELDAGGSLRSEFVYVSGDVAPDYLKQGARTLYLVHDQLGSVRKAIDVATGEVVQELEYDATGNQTRNTNKGVQPFGYAGGLTDLDGRMVHFGARDYDGRTGRWLQPDPIGAAGGPNQYEYVASDAVNRTDPSGLGPETHLRRLVGLIQFIGSMMFPPTPPGQNTLESQRPPSLYESFRDFDLENVNNDLERFKLPKPVPSPPDGNSRPPLPRDDPEWLNGIRRLPPSPWLVPFYIALHPAPLNDNEKEFFRRIRERRNCPRGGGSEW